MEFAFIEFPNPQDFHGNEPIASGGEISFDFLLSAYLQGFFPWYNPEEPILWWNPDPRFVIYIDRYKIPHGSKKVIRDHNWTLKMDSAFFEVISACGTTERKDQDSTWVTSEIVAGYLELHKKGYAHSFEVWENSMLIGGLYGVRMGHVFSGESMFHLKPGASKVALNFLVNYCKSNGILVIDCQQETPLMQSFGGEQIPRTEFLSILGKGLAN